MNCCEEAVSESRRDTSRHVTYRKFSFIVRLSLFTHKKKDPIFKSRRFQIKSVKQPSSLLFALTQKKKIDETEHDLKEATQK